MNFDLERDQKYIRKANNIIQEGNVKEYQYLKEDNKIIKNKIEAFFDESNIEANSRTKGILENVVFSRHDLRQINATVIKNANEKSFDMNAYLDEKYYSWEGKHTERLVKMLQVSKGLSADSLKPIVNEFVDSYFDYSTHRDFNKYMQGYNDSYIRTREVKPEDYLAIKKKKLSYEHVVALPEQPMKNLLLRELVKSRLDSIKDNYVWTTLYTDKDLAFLSDRIELPGQGGKLLYGLVQLEEGMGKGLIVPNVNKSIQDYIEHSERMGILDKTMHEFGNEMVNLIPDMADITINDSDPHLEEQQELKTKKKKKKRRSPRL